MKATARMLRGCLAVICCLTATFAFGQRGASFGPNGLSAGTPSPSSVPATDQRQQAADLLARARQAMNEGHLDVAEQLIARAESLDVRYSPLNPMADTPSKARHELERRRAAAGGTTATMADPFNRQQPVAAPGMAEAISYNSPAPGNPNPGNALASDMSAPGFASIQGDGTSQAGVVSVSAVDPSLRPKSDELLLRARRALAMGDTRVAGQCLMEAKSLRVGYGPAEDSPQRVESALLAYQELMADRQGRGHTESFRRQYARLMMQQAEALLAWREFDEAERLTQQAKGQQVNYGPLDVSPDVLLQRIAMTRRQARPEQQFAAIPTAVASDAKVKVAQLMRYARAAHGAGDLNAAESFARAAAELNVPESSFGPGEDRPSAMLAAIHASRGASGVVQASANQVQPATGVMDPTQRASLAMYDQNRDFTHNMLVGDTQPMPGIAPPGLRPLELAQRPTLAVPRPTTTVTNNPAANNSAMALFQQGEAALRARDMNRAMEYYRQAARLSSQLDPTTAQALQDRMQMLTTGAGGASPAAPPTQSFGSETATQQQLLARQVYSDIVNQERRAMQLRESDPKSALALLEQTRVRVETAGLEPAARDAILRRVDKSLADMRQYIEDNKARIDLAQSNAQTRDEINRRRTHKIEIQEKMALLADQFNRLTDEQNYEQAEVVAKQAVELDPDNPFAQQLMRFAKYTRRYRHEIMIADAKEGGFQKGIQNVIDSSVPFNDFEPYQFCDAKTWADYTRMRQKYKLDQRAPRTEAELEIEQKLRTPVSLQFENAPLRTVLDHLARLSQVNLHLDPQGLADEGINVDTPVTINLRQEIMLKSALNLILEPLRLSYVIKDDVLKVTSERNRRKNVRTQVYNVADLVVPIPNFKPNSQYGLAGAYTDALYRNGIAGGAMGGFGQSPLDAISATTPAGNAMTNGNVLAQQMGGMPGSMTGLPGMDGMPGGGGPGGAGGGTNADFDSLIQLIQQIVAPDSWKGSGTGEGEIHQFEPNLSLVITQTEEVHEEIVDLFQQLRRLQDLQVTIEVRFITLNDSFFERIGIDFDFDINDNIDRPYQVFGRTIDNGDDDDDDDDDATANAPPERNTQDTDNDRSVTVGMSAPGVFSADLDIPFTQNSYTLATPQFGGFDAAAGASLGFAILSDIEAYFFIQAATGDRRTNILQAPKVTLFNGQVASVRDQRQRPFVMSVVPVVGDFAAEQQPIIVVLAEGTFLSVQAVVSPDRRFVRLTVVPYFSQIGDVQTFTFTGSTTTTSDTSTEGNQTTPDDNSKANNVKTTTTGGTTVQLPTLSIVSVSTTVSVPDGGTVLLGGIKRLKEGRNEFGVPMLNKIPYVSRLFKNVGIGRETESLMMMVTPRIIIQEEEEGRVMAGSTSP